VARPLVAAAAAYKSSIDFGQSSLSSRDSERSASSRPFVWHVAQ
jgi:hypothetical protein